MPVSGPGVEPGTRGSSGRRSTGLSYPDRVEQAGFEPAAPWSRTTCATGCATARTFPSWASGRGAGRGTRTGVASSSRPARNGHPAADVTMRCRRTPTVVKEPLPKTLRPAWRVASRRRGESSVPWTVGGGLGSHAAEAAQREVTIAAPERAWGDDAGANAHTRGLPGAIWRQAIARS